MKRVSFILLSFFYLILAVKVKASVHTCGGNVTSISFFEQQGTDDCACGQMTDNSCCNDFSFQLKTDESNTIQKYVSFNFAHQYSILNTHFFVKLDNNQVSYLTKQLFLYKQPPNTLNILSSIILRI